MRKIVIAFDSFKGCMGAGEACQAAEMGVRECCRKNGGGQVPEVVCLPMSDGGEGMVECIAEVTGAKWVTAMVHDPLMRVIEARYAISDDGLTAYMEMAAASGLTLMEKERRNPMVTTTHGVGDMIMDAVRRGCKRIVMGIGGSATCDGGKGMVDCLRGHLPLPVEVVVASDVANPLYGENGAAYVFAPQKGATPEQVRMLDERLRAWAHETERELGVGDGAYEGLAEMPGAGAAGGLGYGLMAYLNAEVRSGIDLLLDITDFDKKASGADMIITGEGKSDRQTLMGKVPMGILARARRWGVPVHILSGAIEDRELLLAAGFASVRSINEGDGRGLDTLMKKDVAIENLRKATAELRG